MLKLIPAAMDKTGTDSWQAAMKGLTKDDLDTFFRFELNIPEGYKEIRFRLKHYPKKIIGEEEHRRAIRKALKIYTEGFGEGFQYRKAEEFLYKSVYPLRNILRVFIYNEQKKYLGEAAQDYNKLWNEIYLNERHASPGLHPTPIRSGCWIIEIQIGSILTDTMEFHLEVDLLEQATFRETVYPERSRFLPVKNHPGSKWKRGQFHVHSNHSDGKNTVQEIANHLYGKGYDFFSLTDHNTVTGWENMEGIPPVTIIGGIEMGACAGHALGMGIKTQIDWRSPDGSLREINEIINEVHNQGGVFGVAHPFVIDYPVCAQCRWIYENTDYSKVDFIEMWLYPFKERFLEMRKALAFWDSLLNIGYHISGSSSIDLHNLNTPPSSSPFPYNMVRSDISDCSSIIDSIRQGNFYATDHVKLELQINCDGKIAGLGETLIIKREAELQLTFPDEDYSGFLKIVSGDGSRDLIKLNNESLVSLKLTGSETASGWIRTELYRDKECTDMSAFTNPVYFD